MTIKCPHCKKGSNSPCENCNASWDLKDGLEIDESFEIISLKEKYLREEYARVEDNFMKSELNVKVSGMVKEIIGNELKKEADKNAR